MGLIDDIRKKRDSWVRRFEEHRQEDESAQEALDPEVEEKKIRESLKRVGAVTLKREKGKR